MKMSTPCRVLEAHARVAYAKWQEHGGLSLEYIEVLEQACQSELQQATESVARYEMLCREQGRRAASHYKAHRVNMGRSSVAHRDRYDAKANEARRAQEQCRTRLTELATAKQEVIAYCQARNALERAMVVCSPRLVVV